MRDLHINVVARPSGWRVYVYAWRGAGAPQVFQAGPFDNRDAAKRAVADALPEIAVAWGEARSGVVTGTVAALCHRWRQSPEWAILAQATRKTYHRHLDAIEATLGHLTARQLGGRIGAEACRLLRDKTAERSLREADALIVTLGALTRYGRAVGALGDDCTPAKGLGGLYVPNVILPMAEADIARAIAQARPEVGWALSLAYETGFRRTDLCRFAWSWIDEEARLVRMPTSKGKRRRRLAVVRLTPALSALLAQIPRRATTVLTHAHGRPWRPDSLGQAVDRELARLQIDGGLHRLRHNAVTRRAAQGVPSRVLAREFGWSEAEVEVLIPIYVDEEAANAAALPPREEVDDA